MLKSVTFKKDYRCFNEGDTFEFPAGITLLVGDQGCGKSTLLEVLNKSQKTDLLKVEMTSDEIVNTVYFDFEKMNPRMQQGFSRKISTMAQVAMRFSSHGQTGNAILGSLPEDSDAVIMLDEPDCALSPRSCWKLLGTLKASAAKGNQIIAAVHNPILIEGMTTVLSLEHRAWMSGAAFLEKHRCDDPNPEKE